MPQHSEPVVLNLEVIKAMQSLTSKGLHHDVLMPEGVEYLVNGAHFFHLCLSISDIAGPHHRLHL
jgi:hypothetical protein